MAFTRDNLENVSALADHENPSISVWDLDEESAKWLSKINKLSREFSILEVPDPVDVESLIDDTIAEIENGNVDRFLRFLTFNLF